MSVSSFDEGDNGEGGVMDSSVPEWSLVVLVESLPVEKMVVLNDKDPLAVMLTRDMQSGVTVTSPIASIDVHLRRSSMAEGCKWMSRIIIINVSNEYDKHGRGGGGHHYHNNVGNWNMNRNCYGGNILFQVNGNSEWGT